MIHPTKLITKRQQLITLEVIIDLIAANSCNLRLELYNFASGIQIEMWNADWNANLHAAMCCNANRYHGELLCPSIAGLVHTTGHAKAAQLSKSREGNNRMTLTQKNNKNGTSLFSQHRSLTTVGSHWYLHFFSQNTKFYLKRKKNVWKAPQTF